MTTTTRSLFACVAASLAIGACDLASPDPGSEAGLQIEDGQYRPGPFPDDDGGPDALALQPSRSTIPINRSGQRMKGLLAATSHAAIIGVDGDPGTWILPAGVPDSVQPDAPTVRAVFALTDRVEPGPVTISVAAVDADGRIGPAISATLVAVDEEPPPGELVVALVWESTADLDVHVVDPLGGEAWSDDPNTWDPPPPGTPVPPGAHLVGGILDRDANSNCHLDGRPREHVIWQQPPPPGEYIVRVDARSMCRDASTPWYAAAYREGEVIGAARGIATPDDTLTPHGEGAGVFAFYFTVP